MKLLPAQCSTHEGMTLNIHVSPCVWDVVAAVKSGEQLESREQQQLWSSLISGWWFVPDYFLARSRLFPGFWKVFNSKCNNTEFNQTQETQAVPM